MSDLLNQGVMEVKCDNEDCDFIEKNIKISEMEKWVDVPCPKCGNNLCTRECSETTKAFTDMICTFDELVGDDFEFKTSGNTDIDSEIESIYESIGNIIDCVNEIYLIDEVQEMVKNEQDI